MLAQESKLSNGPTSRFFANMDALQDPLSLDLDEFPTFGFVSRALVEDNPGFGQATNGPNLEGFREASARELSTLQNLKSWTLVKRQPWMKV